MTFPNGEYAIIPTPNHTIDQVKELALKAAQNRQRNFPNEPSMTFEYVPEPPNSGAPTQISSVTVKGV